LSTFNTLFRVVARSRAGRQAGQTIHSKSKAAGIDEKMRTFTYNEKYPLPAVFNDGDFVLWMDTKYGGMLHYSVGTNKLQVFCKGACQADR
jgi:hypothetical protein